MKYVTAISISLFIFSGCAIQNNNSSSIQPSSQLNEIFIDNSLDHTTEMDVEHDTMLNKLPRSEPLDLSETEVELDISTTHTIDSQTIIDSCNESTSISYPDIKDLYDLYSLKKSEVLKKLGDNYEIVPAGGEGSYDGYYYEPYGITIIFLDESSFWHDSASWDGAEYISSIFCDDNLDINGARLGMTFAEIQAYLPNSRIVQDFNPFEPAYPLFYLVWDYYDIRVIFGAVPYHTIDDLETVVLRMEEDKTVFLKIEYHSKGTLWEDN